MDQSEIDRCTSLASLALGRTPKPGEMDPLIAESSSFAEFRVRMILNEELGSKFTSVADRWRMAVPQKAGLPSRSLSSLAYAIEHIVARLDALDGRIEKQESELLDAAKRLDTIATTHRDALKDSTDLRAIAHVLRTRLTTVAARDDERKNT